MTHFLKASILAACCLACAAAPAREEDVKRSMGGALCKDSPYNCAAAVNPLPPPNTVWMEDMTWMEARDAIAAGKTTAIIPVGGLDPNGPWIAISKHNLIMHTMCEAIARKLGNALCAPIVKFVPLAASRPSIPIRRAPSMSPNRPTKRCSPTLPQT